QKARGKHPKGGNHRGGLVPRGKEVLADGRGEVAIDREVVPLHDIPGNARQHGPAAHPSLGRCVHTVLPCHLMRTHKGMEAEAKKKKGRERFAEENRPMVWASSHAHTHTVEGGSSWRITLPGFHEMDPPLYLRYLSTSSLWWQGVAGIIGVKSSNALRMN